MFTAMSGRFLLIAGSVVVLSGVSPDLGGSDVRRGEEPVDRNGSVTVITPGETNEDGPNG